MLAAGLLLVAAATGVFLIATLCFLISAVLVWQANLPRHTSQRQAGFWSKALRGPRLFLSVPEFRAVIALDMAMALAAAMVMVNSVVIVQGLFDLDADAAALAFFTFGAGSVVGALVLSRILPLLPDRTVMLAGAAMIVLALLTGALVQTYTALLILWAVLGLGVALALTPVSFLIRRIAPPADLQTLFAAQFSISNSCLLVAYALAGWAGAELGIPAVFLLLAALAAAATLAAMRLWPQPA
jgi:predicted MFS family arabinose efflux permease